MSLGNGQETRAQGQRGAPRGWNGLLLPILIGYFAIVGLAAWPAPVRPAGLDAAHVAANRWLQRVSIMPGHKVFALPDRATWMTVADCHHIRALDRQGRVHDLWPPDGRCVRGGPRFYVAPIAVYLSRTLERMGARLGEPDAAVHHGHTFSAIGRAFCGRGGRGEAGFETIAVDWLRDLRSYREGTQRSQSVLAFSWSCETQQIRFVEWFPKRSTLRPLRRAAG